MKSIIFLLKACTLLVLCLVSSGKALAVNEADLLQPDAAFKFSIERDSNSVLAARWVVADGYYIYKDKLSLTAEGVTGLNITASSMPESQRLNDSTFGDVDIFRNNVLIKYAMTGNIDETATIKAKYQGCSDLGVCYPPIRKSYSLADIVLAAHSKPLTLTDTKKLVDTEVTVSEQDSIAASLSSDSFLLTLLSFFGFGLLLAFTPCVFPMIPILSGIIIGQGKSLSTKKALSLSVVYVLAMASAYTVVGVLAALFGTNLQVWFQTPWVLGTFAGVFVLLSLSMFGFYELQMPSSIQNKLNKVSNKQESGNLISAGIMGFLSALIVGPCVTAPLIGALIYIGQTGDALLGGSALFALGLGMGAPLLVVGASAGKFLPKAGAWMEAVKGVFGVLMLAVAIWLVSRVLPALLTQLLWAVLIIVSSIYLGALRQHTAEVKSWTLLWKGLGYILFLYGSLMIIGVATGKANLLAPLQGFVSSQSQGITTNDHEGLAFKKIKSSDDLDAVLAEAKQKGQTVMLDFYADWCISCKEMEVTTFTDEKVISSLAGSVTIQADVTANDADDVQLLKRFGLIGPPAILFFNPDCKEMKHFRLVGYSEADKFAQHVKKAIQ